MGLNTTQLHVTPGGFFSEHVHVVGRTSIVGLRPMRSGLGASDHLNRQGKRRPEAGRWRAGHVMSHMHAVRELFGPVLAPKKPG